MDVGGNAGMVGKAATTIKSARGLSKRRGLENLPSQIPTLS